MTIKTRYVLCRQQEGTMAEIFSPDNKLPPAIHLQDVCALIRNLTFIVEVTPGLKDGITASRVLDESSAMLSALED